MSTEPTLVSGDVVVGCEITDGKRFRIPGVLVTQPCPECGAEIVWGDDYDDYLSYPVVGEPAQISCECLECENYEMVVNVVVAVNVRLATPEDQS